MTGQRSPSEQRAAGVAPGAWWRRWLDSPLGVAALALVVYTAFTLARLYLLGGDISRFVMAGQNYISPQSGASVGLSVLPRGLGYDGQFYYLLALNPFAPHGSLPGAHLDVPAYRAQRILFPLVVWALSLGGRPALIPAIMVIVNLLAIAAIGACGAALSRRLGAAPLWGGLVALYPGLLVSLAGDLGEPLALALVLGGLLFARDRRWGWASLLFSLAALARETTVLIPVALLVAAALTRLPPRATSRLPAIRLVPREEWRGAVVAGVAPLLVACAWQGVLWARWGEVGALAHDTSNTAPPLVGLLESFAIWAILKQPWLQVALYAGAVYLVGLFEMTRRTLWRERGALSFLALAWGLYAALLTVLSVNVWDIYWNSLRAASEFGVLSLLLLAVHAPSRMRWIALGVTAALWLVVFAAVVGATAPAL